MACSIIHVVLKKVAVVVRRTSKGMNKQIKYSVSSLFFRITRFKEEYSLQFNAVYPVIV